MNGVIRGQGGGEGGTAGEGEEGGNWGKERNIDGVGENMKKKRIDVKVKKE